MTAFSRAAAMLLCVLAALLSPAAMASFRPSLISMPTVKPAEDTRPLADGGLTADYHDTSCPDLQKMVRAAVEDALEEDITIAAGLLRIFFHDCFVDPALEAAYEAAHADYLEAVREWEVRRAAADTYNGMMSDAMAVFFQTGERVPVMGERPPTPGLLPVFPSKEQFSRAYYSMAPIRVGDRVFFSEQVMGPNTRLQPKALQLIEDIRVKVHDACGHTVSCADITVLATRDAVVVAGGHSYDLLLGRNDNFLPARWQDVYRLLPTPTLNASQLIEFFDRRGLDELDVVALSGAHTIGKAHCDSFSDRFDRREDAEFVQSLAANCSADGHRLQDLDVATPRRFDNAYYRNLVAGKGVLTSDQTLMDHPRTRELVEGFAKGELNYWFFNQFGTSMKKLSVLDLDIPGGRLGEIRRYGCFRPNSARPA